MKFQAPVGTEEERKSGKIWPGGWTDATGFLNSKTPSYAYGIHTGADLNWNTPRWDADRLAPVYSIGDGVVTYAQTWPNPNYWGKIIVIDHGMIDGKPLYSRYAHVAHIRVTPGETVKMGQQISQVGDGSSEIRAKAMFPFHLHFDISVTKILREQPQNWPAPSTNRDKKLVQEHYVDPEQWLRQEHNLGNLPETIDGTSSSTSDDKPPRTNIDPPLPTWYVIAPEVTVYKEPHSSAEKSGTLSRGKKISIANAGGRDSKFEWGRIVGGTFDGEWLPIRKADKSESYISTNPPQ